MAESQPSPFRILVVTVDEFAIRSTFESLFPNENYDEDTFTLNFTYEDKQVVVRGAWPDCEFKLGYLFDATVMVVEYGSQTTPVTQFAEKYLLNSVHKVLVSDNVEQSASAAGYGASVFAGQNRNEVLPFLLNLDRQLDEAIQRVFVSFDKDNSGYIDINELYAVGRELGIELTEIDIESVLTDIDQNQDGKISLEEFSKWWKGGRQGKAKIFRRMTGLQAKVSGLLDNANLELLQELVDGEQQRNAYEFTLNLGDPSNANWRNSMNLQFKTERDEEVDQILAKLGINKTNSSFIAGFIINLQGGADADAVVERMNSSIRKATNLLSSMSRNFAMLLMFLSFKVQAHDGKLYVFIELNLPENAVHKFDRDVWDRSFKYFLSEEHPLLLQLEVKQDNSIGSLLSGESVNLDGLFGTSQYRFTANIWHGLLNWALETGAAHIKRKRGAFLVLLGLLEQSRLTLNFKSTRDLPDEIKSLTSQAQIPPISTIKEMIQPLAQVAFQQVPFLKDTLLSFRNDLDLSEVTEVVTFRTVNFIAHIRSEDAQGLYRSLFDLVGVENQLVQVSFKQRKRLTIKCEYSYIILNYDIRLQLNL